MCDKTRMAKLIAIVLVSFLSWTLCLDRASALEVWERQNGLYADGAEVSKGKITLLDLSKIKLATKKVNDLQYRRTETYRGLPLSDVIAEARRSFPQRELAVLHFANGMTILWTSERQKDAVFLAVKIKDGKSWSTAFPDIGKFNEYYKDPRPIKFSDNKIAFDVAPAKLPGPDDTIPFNPWVHTNSLTGVEFVQKDAYVQQFNYGSHVAAGQAVFLKRCVYCHGVRRVGATYGWDFVHPIPIYKKRQKEDLFYHVKYPKADALSRGLMMPNQLDFTEENAAALWEFMKQAATAKSVKPYKASP